MIKVDYSDNTPLYSQVEKQIEILIVNDTLKPNSTLPSIRKMATSLEISSITIKKAYEILENNSIIQSKRSKYFFVTSDAKVHIITKKKCELKNMVLDIYSEAKAYGIDISSII